MLNLISNYLKDKEFSWSEKTKLSVLATLRQLSPRLTGDPKALWEYLLINQQPYSRVTSWGRICQFWDFIKPTEENPYRVFKSKNKLLFKNAYVRKPANEDIKSAQKKIESIANPAIKRKALELLYSGMRWSESLTLQNGFIKGKGGYQRQVFLPEVEGPEYNGSYRNFLRILKDIGLKTHSLRKIYLTECVRKGATIFELQALAGWTNLESAKSYINVPQDRLKEITEGVRRPYDQRRK